MKVSTKHFVDVILKEQKFGCVEFQDCLISAVNRLIEKKEFNVRFSCDSFICYDDFTRYFLETKEIPVGIQFIGNETIMICYAENYNSEFPIFFVLYIDENDNLKGFVPELGNVFCHKYNCSYGMIDSENSNNIVIDEIDKTLFAETNYNEVAFGRILYNRDKETYNWKLMKKYIQDYLNK